MTTKTINIAKDFSRFPGGRYRSDGPHSGEEFRDDVLAPALKTGTSVILVLDGVAGLPSSFQEEAFGGLVRRHGFTAHQLETALQLVAETERMKSYPAAIRRYIHRAGNS